MIEYTCEVCGKVKYAKCRRDAGRFCSKRCYGYGIMTGLVQKGNARKPSSESTADTCKFNPVGVICDTKNCKECGWNPAVAKRRLERYGVSDGETS